MKQAEKALRDAGWVEVIANDLREGEEFYMPARHVTGIARNGGYDLAGVGTLVLRPPRPEPEYELGTVARVRVYSGEEFSALMDEYGMWRTVDDSYQPGSVEVLRVIAYPDGSTPWIKPTGNQVDQIKVIDESGYGYVNTSARDVEYAFEDDGKTLEVFTGGTGSTPGESVTTKGVTRVEVIDDTGLAYLNTAARDIEVELQDDGRTLKIFTGGTDERFLEMANELLSHLKPHGKDNTK